MQGCGVMPDTHTVQHELQCLSALRADWSSFRRSGVERDQNGERTRRQRPALAAGAPDASPAANHSSRAPGRQTAE